MGNNAMTARPGINSVKNTAGNKKLLPWQRLFCFLSPGNREKVLVGLGTGIFEPR
jgi:hypothetical protein